MAPTLEDYQKMLEQLKPLCKWCEGKVDIDLSKRRYIDTYNHEDGWEVDGFKEKQWLSVRCPHCEYDWSLWKLGIPRPRGIEVVTQ